MQVPKSHRPRQSFSTAGSLKLQVQPLSAPLTPLTQISEILLHSQCVCHFLQDYILDFFHAGAASRDLQEQVDKPAYSTAQPEGGFPAGPTNNNVPIPSTSSGRASSGLQNESSAAGWLSGAAGLLASSRQASAEEDSSTDAAVKSIAGKGGLE